MVPGSTFPSTHMHSMHLKNLDHQANIIFKDIKSWNRFPQYSRCVVMEETCMLVKYHICYQQFCSTVTSKVFCILLHQKSRKTSSLFQKTLLGRHQEKLQVEEATCKVNSIFSRKRKKKPKKQVLETKDL